MKRLVKYISFLVLLLVVAAVALPFLVPVETVKKIAIEKVKEMTGRDLVIDGDIKASLWPNIGITLQKVSLSNPGGFSDKNLIEMDGANVGVALMPLLKGNIQIKEIVVNKPVVHLEINRHGVKNWEFNNAENNAAETGEKSVENTIKRPLSSIPTLGSISINDGSFTYTDAVSGKYYIGKEVDLGITMPSADSPITVKAAMNFNKEKVKIALDVKSPAQLMQGGESKVSVSGNIASLALFDFAGKASMKAASGNIDINIPSLVDFSGWSGKKLDWKGDTKLAMTASGEINCSTTDCNFSKAKIVLDDSTISGDGKVNFAGAVPAVDGKFKIDELDLNQYLPKNKKQAGLSLVNDAQAATPAWDASPIDLSGLRAANAKISLDIGELVYQATKLSKVDLSLNLEGGALTLDVPDIGIYEGTAKIAATANASGAVSANINAKQVQIAPLLKDFAQFERLTGLAGFDIAITGKATSQRELMSSLNGNGKFEVKDGTISGVDLGKIVASTKAMVTGVDTSSEKTKFSELGGSFTIKQGIVTNNDLAMKAPLLRVGGQGTVDLPNRYVKYRLLPSVVATLQGQGGKDKQGLEIPVNVEGDFESLRFTPDLASVAKDALKDPQKIKDTVKSLKESIKQPGGVKDLLKGFR